MLFSLCMADVVFVLAFFADCGLCINNTMPGYLILLELDLSVFDPNLVDSIPFCPRILTQYYTVTVNDTQIQLNHCMI